MSAVQGMITRLQCASQSFNFGPATLSAKESIVDANLMRGSLSHQAGRAAASIIAVNGQIRFEPNVVEMPLLNTWAMGGASSTLADTALVQQVIVDKKAVGVFNYASTAVNRATWSASQGEPLALTLDVVALTEVGGASWGSPTAINDATPPYMFQGLALSFASTSYTSRSFNLVLDNHLDTGRYHNSQTLTALVWTDRVVTLNLDLPAGDAIALYGTGEAGVSVSAVFTNGANTMTMSMAKLVFGKTGPVISGRSELMLTIQGQAYASGATGELVLSYS